MRYVCSWNVNKVFRVAEEMQPLRKQLIIAIFSYSLFWLVNVPERPGYTGCVFINRA